MVRCEGGAWVYGGLVRVSGLDLYSCTVYWVGLVVLRWFFGWYTDIL